MSVSVNPRVVAIAATALAIMGAAYMLRQNDPAAQSDTPTSAADHPSTDIRTDRRAIKSNQPRPSFASHTATPREVTTGVTSLAMQTPAALPPLTGYALDHFDTWTTIPASYRADGLTVANGTITLAGNAQSTDSRTGIMVSPPLTLKLPALAAPAPQSPPLPEGANVIVEISLTQDGEDWSPWAVLERYSPPDGKRVAPPLQMALSTAQIAAYDDPTTQPISPPPGPAIRYRMTLSSSGTKAPSVADVRIWKREYQ